MLENHTEEEGIFTLIREGVSVTGEVVVRPQASTSLNDAVATVDLNGDVDMSQTKGSEKQTNSPTQSVSTKAAPTNETEQRQNSLVRRGAEMALEALSKRFGSLLFDEVPKIWECMSTALLALEPETRLDVPRECNTSQGQDLIDNLSVLMTIVPFLHSDLYNKVHILIPQSLYCTYHSYQLPRLRLSFRLSSNA
jgi:hypothetical protein